MQGRIACALLLLAASGCKPGLPSEPRGGELPDLSGEWSYAASDIRPAGSTASGSCSIEGVVLTLGPWRREGFSGRSSEGALRCSGDMSRFSGPLPSYPVRNGGMAFSTPWVAFDLGTPDWRHDGTLSHDTVTLVVLGDTIRRMSFGDTLRGSFRLRNGGVEMTGAFRAVRRAR